MPHNEAVTSLCSMFSQVMLHCSPMHLKHTYMYNVQLLLYFRHFRYDLTQLYTCRLT